MKKKLVNKSLLKEESMKITKNMLNEGLRGGFLIFSLMPIILSKKFAIKLFNSLSKKTRGKEIPGLQCDEVYIPSQHDGPDIRVRIFKPIDATDDLPGMAYFHGGGYIIGNPEIALGIIEDFIAKRACVVVAPDYRKSLEAPFPAAFDDCYDTLLWLKENAKTLGVKPDGFIVGGHSAGGGLTAAVTLKARDTKDVNIAFQMPVYPMIDDRQIKGTSADFVSPVWSSKSNKVGWDLYLKGLKTNNSNIPPYAAPARNTDYANFPPTITFVGDKEPFKDETLSYVDNLRNANIPVEFKLYEGCFHGFETIVPKAEISKNATIFLLDSYASYFDRYIK